MGIDMTEQQSATPDQRSFIFIYGPPGSGKSLLGRLLARSLNLNFIDLDELIEKSVNATISEIFTCDGEARFRKRECENLDRILEGDPSVVALGGGALLNEMNREKVESAGEVLCLQARPDTILARLNANSVKRPLLAGGEQQMLLDLLSNRAEHYKSFSLNMPTDQGSPESLVWEAQIQLGKFHVTGMEIGYDVIIANGGLGNLGPEMSDRGLGGPVAVVSDDNVAPFYVQGVIESLSSSGYKTESIIIPAGENNKTINTITTMWEKFVSLGLDRGSTVVALGGGMVGDLGGFAAATYLRGVSWVCVPTSILAMVDASLGGKTGADLSFGKNLIGAFHPPGLVYADPTVLSTLPEAEKRSGMAEVLKHGIISDPILFDMCSCGLDVVDKNLDEIIRRAMAVKVQVICEDPYERGVRATLNLGHTLGHAVEKTSNYTLRHGEAVAIGMVAAARYSEESGLAEDGLTQNIEAALERIGLPIRMPDSLPHESIIRAMGVDKKRAAGKVKLVLPVAIGDVRYGIPIDDLTVLVKAAE